ncbi:thymidine kinase [bacterium]|nr:thymidine kinase [bacterium]
MKYIPKGMGWIDVITGCMFSGKSEELIRRLRRVLIAKKELVVFKPEIDDRYDEAYVVSHSAQKIEAINIRNSNEIARYIKDTTEVVGIDEAQFFDKGIVDVVGELASRGICVIIAGLDQDYRGKPFGPMPELTAIADDVLKTQAICMRCGNPATKTQRIVKNDAQILVGANELYEARCRNCFEAPDKE